LFVENNGTIQKGKTYNGVKVALRKLVGRE
jgi:hypothetical protein